MNDFEDKDSKIIETKELPIVSFCAYCDKPIFVGEEYVDVEFFDDTSKKRFNKKKLTHGYAHKHCAEEKEKEVALLKEQHKKKTQVVLAASIVSGFVFAIALMLILIFATDLHLAISVIIPWLIGYLVVAHSYILVVDETFGSFCLRLFKFLVFVPVKIYRSPSDDSVIYSILKIVLIIILTPLAYLSLIIIAILLSLVSAVLFPISLTKKDN